MKYRMDLVPPKLIVGRYFADEQTKLDELAATAEEATQSVEEYVEEHAVEDGLLAEAMDDDKISKALASARLQVAKREGSDPDEVHALEHLKKLYDAEATAKRAMKDAQAALDVATFKKYGDLTGDEIKRVVLDDKWHATVAKRISDEVNSLTLALVARIQELGERYDRTVTDLEISVAELGVKVARHLADMGVK